MDCPKCGGGAYLLEEELVKILENTEPIKILLKAVYQCRACSEKFSRLVYDNLEARKKQESTEAPKHEKTEPVPVEGLRFF